MSVFSASSSCLSRVMAVLEAQPVVDMHTHLYPPSFGACSIGGGEGPADPLMLWGIDELLSYHYFVDELFRVIGYSQLTPAGFWAMKTSERADLVWRELFVERTPISEACQGLVGVLIALGLDPREKTLEGYRAWFAQQDPDTHVDRVMGLAGVSKIVMTNEPFSDTEHARWMEDAETLRSDPRFDTVLRVDPLFERWTVAAEKLEAWGFRVDANLTTRCVPEVSRFLVEWIERMNPRYLACSLSPEFVYDPDSVDPAIRHVSGMFDKCVLPIAKERGLPVALMIGARRGVHPEMGLAGDGLGRTDIDNLCELARAYPEQRFLVTYLSRENQHELCVAARKFGNITPFGCWWFLNTTSIIEEMTRERFELLGSAFVPQHSDARVLEQLIYKWRHARKMIGSCLAERYDGLEGLGYVVTDEQIRADAQRLLAGNYESVLKG